MPTAKRLNVVSFSGPDIDFFISDETFLTLEEIYNRKLTASQRERMHFLCSQYLHWKRVEDVAETFTDLERLFAKARDAVERFKPLAFGSLTPMTDAGGELSGMLETHLSAQTIAVPRGALRIYDEEVAAYVEADLEGPPLRLGLTLDILMEVAFGLDATITGVEREIADLKSDKSKPGFTPGEAFNTWLRTMHFWAKENGFTFGPYVNNTYTGRRGPTTFAQMLYELNKLFPDGYREVVASPLALAERLRLALKPRA